MLAVMKVVGLGRREQNFLDRLALKEAGQECVASGPKRPGEQSEYPASRDAFRWVVNDWASVLPRPRPTAHLDRW